MDCPLELDVIFLRYSSFNSPPQKRLDSIELVFTTREHGTSIQTLYMLTEGFSPMILIIETTQGSIFGAYLSQPWITDNNEGKFYGNGMPRFQ